MPIAFKNEFSLETEPKVPLRLRQKVDEKLPYGRSVAVVREADSKQRTINSFRLSDGEGPRPNESTDEVAQAIANVMQWESLRCLAADQHEAVGEGLTFIIKIARFAGQRATVFRFRWRLVEGDEPAEESVFEDAELDENSHQYLHGIIALQNAHIDRFMVNNERMLEANLQMAERTQKPLELVGQQLGFANSILMQGMQGMVNAMQTVWSFETHKQAEEAKTARLESIMEKAAEHLGPAVKIGAQQLMMYVGKKMQGAKGPVPRGRDIVTNPPPAQPTQPEPSARPEPEPIDALLTCVLGFGESLKPVQRKALRTHFEPEQLDAFDELLGSDSGDQVKERFTALQELLGGDLDPLMAALESFSEEQQQLAMHIVAACMGMGDEDEDESEES